jgi:CBS domain-containing protein
MGPEGTRIAEDEGEKEDLMPRPQHRTASRAAVSAAPAARAGDVPRRVTVKDVMCREVKTLERNPTLDVAEALMVVSRIRHVPIVEEDGTVVGMVSNRDIFRSALAFALGYGDRGRTAMHRLVRVKDVMVEPVVTIGPGASMAEAAGLMVEHRIGCLPVIENGKLLGIVTETDILRQACLGNGA